MNFSKAQEAAIFAIKEMSAQLKINSQHFLHSHRALEGGAVTSYELFKGVVYQMKEMRTEHNLKNQDLRDLLIPIYDHLLKNGFPELAASFAKEFDL